MKPITKKQSFLILIVLPIIWWWPLLTGQLPDFMDTVTLLYPMRMAAAQQFWDGTLPLWFPNLAAGAPLAANPQIAVWYPPHWLFFLVPTATMNGLVMILHYWVAGFGMWLLAKRTGTCNWAALFGAVGLQFGSMLVSRIALTPHLSSMAWLPLILWGIEKSVTDKSPWRGSLWVAFFFAVQVLSGAPQISYYTAIVLPIWWLARGWANQKPTLTTLKAGFLAATLSALLTSIQLIPVFELMNLSTRMPIEESKLVVQGLAGSMVFRSLFGFTGETIEDTDTINAIGFGLMLLIPLAFRGKRRRRLIIPLLCAGLVMLVFSLSAVVPLLHNQLPLYSSFHSPRRALIIWSVLGPLAAAHGAQVLLAYLRKTPWRRIAPCILLLFLAGNLWMLPRLEREFTSIERLNPHPHDVQLLKENRFLTMDFSLRYSYESRDPMYGYSVMPNLAALHNYYDVQTYDPVILKRMALMRDISTAQTGRFYPSHGIFLSNPNSPLLKMLNVQHIIGRVDAYYPSDIIPGAVMDLDKALESLDLIRDHPFWPLYRYKEEFPLAWLVSNVVEKQSAQDSMVLALVNDPLKVAFLEKPLAKLQADPRPAVARSVQAERTTASSFSINISPTPMRAQFLCISSVYMPGWKAVTDAGETLEVVPANGLILGMLVPPGTQSVYVYYSPNSFKIGALFTVFGLLLFLFVYRKSKPIPKEIQVQKPTLYAIN